jgi:hypothetical protein
LGIVLFCLRFPDQALARSSAAIAEARKLASSDVFGCGLEYRHQAPFRLSEVTQSWVSERTQLVAVATEQRFPRLAFGGDDLSRLGKGLVLQPACKRVLADGHVEPQPPRALEMWMEDRATRERDASALGRFRQCQRVVNMREALPDKHAGGRLREQFKPDAFEGATDAAESRSSRAVAGDGGH